MHKKNIKIIWSILLTEQLFLGLLNLTRLFCYYRIFVVNKQINLLHMVLSSPLKFLETSEIEIEWEVKWKSTIRLIHYND